MADDVLTAERIGAVAKWDPQLRIPVRPRVRRGLVIAVGAGEVAVEGGPKRQLFRGASATEFLPRLLEACTGERSHARLAEELEVPEEIVFKALSLLWTCGVVEEAAPETPLSAPVPDPLADVLSRLGDSTGANPAWEQAVARLRSARVEAFGDPELIRLLDAELSDSLTIQPAADVVPRADTTFVVSLGMAGRELAEHCWDKNIPLLRLRLSGRRAILGPLTQPGLSPCLDCQAAEDGLDERDATAADAGLAVALFARELFALISRAVPSTLPIRWRSVDLETLGHAELSAATRPGCPRCSIAGGPAAERASLAARYEAAVSLPPKAFADIKAHQMHYKPSNIALQSRSKTWPVAPCVALPVPRPERLADPTPSGKITGEETALLLATVAGIQGVNDQRVQRWTASGGNIGSVTAYAAVRDVPGIEPGLYGYVLSEQRLAWLSPEVGAVGGDAPLTMVLTGDFAKVAQKYGPFALRIVLLDSGCAQATAREVGGALGLRLDFRLHWDDASIGHALNVRPDSEPITAVIDFSTPIGGAR
ncbi:hypothetical protein Skr01_21560 [Sphaerisporangium krabiense]|uniref:SagB-type dehydrogenase family enzyme n=1 Tax=Sphaerisporangium krabiense TaxID=763782 RepID=A0A7W8Z5R3_9ACTN|nr:tpaE [Sphaerisporangium krabiense]MBB5627911.1 SagB-type dehydrogenase family enzyme [Sphaerisporangium krabiense]GII62071.1 hypothetical protein Skr01_21560 [Sphaerisporangium krabiense]